MVTIQLKPPEPFNFKTPDEWPRWRRCFEQFRVASGLGEESATKQISTLLYCLGEEAESVLTSTNATEDERKVYDTVMGKFDAFFQVRRNVIFERARFNRRNQLPGESSEQYIMALYSLAAYCNYGALEPEMIRDRLVVGIRDSSLSERLQLDAEFTLEKAKKSIHQREAVQQQQQVLKGAGEPSGLEALHHDRYAKRQRGRQQHRGTTHSGGRAKQNSTSHSGTKPCTRCGKGTHPRDKCPATDAVCHRCHRKGHYGAMCYAKTLAVTAVSGENSSDTAFLDMMRCGRENAWFTPIQLSGQETLFKLDTGAEVTAISVDTYQHIRKPHLHTPDKVLYGPSRQPLLVQGRFLGNLVYKTKSSQQHVFVVKGLQTNLLGLPAITALHLAARVDMTSCSETEIHQRFPKVFEGLGNLGEEFEIKLKPDAVPHSLFTPRHVLLPLRPKVEQELMRMESMGVISRVDEPTPWCAGMVVVPKKSGSIRICVDLKPLNESVLREVHPLPKVDETLA